MLSRQNQYLIGVEKQIQDYLYASSSAVDDLYWENPYAMSKWINEQMAPPNALHNGRNAMYGLLRDNGL